LLKSIKRPLNKRNVRRGNQKKKDAENTIPGNIETNHADGDRRSGKYRKLQRKKAPALCTINGKEEENLAM